MKVKEMGNTERAKVNIERDRDGEKENRCREMTGRDMGMLEEPEIWSVCYEQGMGIKEKEERGKIVSLS